MVILITGASHTGKTALAQKLLEKYAISYLSMDHLKMGLIRSGNTDLMPLSDDADMMAYLWPIVREMVKTAIENGQNLTVEGCYIPFDWQKDFTQAYLTQIRYYCLIMSKEYIWKHFDEIKSHANVIEHRLDDCDYTFEQALQENGYMLQMAQQYELPYLLIDDRYEVDIDLEI